MTDNLNSKNTGFNGDILKLIAAASMLVDHTGAILFPHIMFLRIIGRLAFPIFVFFIAEGCIYTKNKVKYLKNLCLFAVITQLVKAVFNDTDDFNVLFTFAIAAVVIFTFQKLTDSVSNKNKKQSIYFGLLFAAVVVAVWHVNRLAVIQYSFWGCMAPFIVYLSRYIDKKDVSRLYIKLFMLAVAMYLIYTVYGGVQIYAFSAVPLLCFYTGKKGDNVPKYFFYVFYPAHLAVLYMLKNII